MPSTLTYPGVYIEELPSGVRTITGVATSITAFIGNALRGPTDEPVRVQSFAEFERAFGGLWVQSTLGYAVAQFFLNGGGDGLIVRVYHKPSAAQVTAGAAADGIAVTTLQSGGVAAQGTLTVLNPPADGKTMQIDQKTYTFRDTAGVAAQGTLTFDTNPGNVNTDTMTIGGQVYKFQAALTNVAGNILIGATLQDTQANIVAAINADAAGNGTKYAAATVKNPDVEAGTAFNASNKLVLTARTAGKAGETIPTTETFAAATNAFDANTLGTTRPGVDPGLADVDGNIAIGATVPDTQKNIVAAINRDPTGAGSRYAASTTGHPTVAADSAFGANNKLVLTAKTPGAAGNSIGTTSTLTGGDGFDGTTLKNARLGVDSGPGGPGPVLAAASPGAWANNLRVRIDHATRNPSDTKMFNMEIREIDPGAPATTLKSEKFLNLSVDSASALFVDNVLQNRSTLARVRATSSQRPDEITDGVFAGGSDGSAVDDNDIQGSAANKTGISALEKADLFNLLCIPPLTNASGDAIDIQSATRNAAAQYCATRRALFIADPSNGWTSHTSVISALGAHIDPSANAALFFPMLLAADPLRDNQIAEFAPCGAVAGVMARTDSNRGVWKAPAGIEATLNGTSALSVKLTDGENGQLNPLGVNCLRSFPVIGRVVWGARTMRGADQLADQWKYIPVRRLALYIEESLFRGTKWVVFEPNDEPLWSQIRLNIGGFMNTLFRQAAFQGATPKDAYFVKCSRETTTQTDIDNGVVNIIVGFAPLKPAEFVVIQIQQIAGQTQS